MLQRQLLHIRDDLAFVPSIPRHERFGCDVEAEEFSIHGVEDRRDERRDERSGCEERFAVSGGSEIEEGGQVGDS